MRPQTLEAQGPLNTLTTDGTVRPNWSAEHEDPLWAVRGPTEITVASRLKQGNRKDIPRTRRAW